VGAAPDLRPPSGTRGQGAGDHPAHRGVERRLNDLAHNHEVRWPYVFVSAYGGRLQVFTCKTRNIPRPWDGTNLRVHARNGFGGLRTGKARAFTMAHSASGTQRRCLILLTDSNTGGGCSRWTASADGMRRWPCRTSPSAQDWDQGHRGRATRRQRQRQRRGTKEKEKGEKKQKVESRK